MMELPQARPFGDEGRKPTHDFLTLCTLPNLQQDPTLRPSQENFLKMHDFLGKTSAMEEVSTEISSADRSPTAAPPPSREHLLPGGIGTYSISHISYLNQRGLKPEETLFPITQTSSTTYRNDDYRNDDNSNCSSYVNSSFILWEESIARKGKTGKENSQTKETAMKGGQWPLSERPSQSSSTNNNDGNSLSSLSSFQPSRQKNQSFLDMIKSAKAASSQEEELEDDEVFLIKKEISPAPRDLRVKVDGCSSDHKANTHRSKHSATEQRRRSKINDRFQALRTLLPQNDQKKDKASFLLEVIEYIQFLQERVQKFEGSYSGWNQERAKMMTWRSDQRLAQTYEDHSPTANAGSATLAFATKLSQNISTAGTSKNHAEYNGGDHVNRAVVNESVSFPVSVLPNILVPARVNGPNHLSQMVDSDLLTKGLQPQSHVDQTNLRMGEFTALNDKIMEQELPIEDGTISISTAFSRGLFDTLTQALHSSGVDLSQASISVQIELGKRAKSSTQQDSEAVCGNQGSMTRARASEDDSAQAMKKLKTKKS